MTRFFILAGLAAAASASAALAQNAEDFVFRYKAGETDMHMRIETRLRAAADAALAHQECGALVVDGSAQPTYCADVEVLDARRDGDLVSWRTDSAEYTLNTADGELVMRDADGEVVRARRGAASWDDAPFTAW